MIVGVLLLENLLIPWLVKRGRHITVLQRIGAGFVSAMLSCVAAAVVEIVRLDVVARHGLQGTDPTADGSPGVPMSVWWQVPQVGTGLRYCPGCVQARCSAPACALRPPTRLQYVFEGFSELLAVAGSLELFYSQAPDAMVRNKPLPRAVDAWPSLLGARRTVMLTGSLA